VSAAARAEALNAEGTALAARHAMAEAEAKFREAVAADPSLAKAHNNLGNVLRRRGAAAEAEAAYRKALELGGSARARRNLAVLLAEQGRTDALAALGEGLAGAEQAELASALAEVAEARGDVARAGAAWLAVRDLDPSHPKVAEGLARTVAEIPFGPGLRAVVPESRALITPFVLREQGDWFEDELRFVRRLLEPGDAAIDIGANFGVYALSMAARVGPEGRVLAFEPASTTHRFLVESARRLGASQLEILRAALSSERGRATFFNAASPELSSLHAEAVDGSGWTETVPLARLDDFEASLGGREASFVKLDAEGEEVRILEGAAAVLRAHDPLVMAEVVHGATRNTALLAKLAALGMRLYVLAPGPLVLRPLEAADDSEYLLNVFACTPRRAARLRERGLAAEPVASAPPPELAAAGARKAAASRPPAMRPPRELASLADAYFAATLDPTPDRALGRLFESLSEAKALRRASPSLGAACALARIAADVGRRADAVEAARFALDALDHGLSPSDVALAPTARFDAEPIRTTAAAWVEAAVIDLLLHRDGYSSIFNRELVALAKRAQSSPHEHAYADGIVRLGAGG
jgi:FkbM family methyltransferase